MSTKAPCRTTHPQILAGRCPWCSTPIGYQPAVAGPQAPNDGERRWGVIRMKSDLEHEDQEVRLISVLNARLHPPIMSEAVELFRVALSNSVERVRENATMALALLGDKISAPAIKDYEAESRSQPGDLAVRIEVRPQNQTTWPTEQMWRMLRVIVGC